jgi:hypothetical protein
MITNQIGMSANELSNKLCLGEHISQGGKISSFDKSDMELQRAANIKLMQMLMGRPSPIKMSSPRPNREGLCLLTRENLFQGSYPRYLNSDKGKFEWLKERYSTDSVSFDVLLELLSVLKIEQKDKDKFIMEAL